MQIRATEVRTSKGWFLLVPWLMCALGAIFYCYEYLLRISPSVMTAQLIHSYHITIAATLGNLSAYYYYIYAPMQIPVGMLMDRYGPRRLLTLAGLACALGTYFFASSTHLWLAEAGRFLVGFGSAFAFVGVLKLATIWLPPERFGLMSGITLSLGMVGAMVGDVLLVEMVKVEGWRVTSYIAAVAGVMLALLMFLILRDGAKHADTNKSDSLPKFGDAFSGFYEILLNPQIWINGLIGCLLYVPTSAFAELWGIPYLEQARHFTPMHAAEAVSMIFLGWAIGGPIVGFISDQLRLRRMPITIGGVIATILLVIIFYVPNLSMPFIYIAFFIFGMFSSAQILVFAIGRENSPYKSAGSAIALTNMFVMLGGVLFQPLIGWLLDCFWSGKIVHGAHIFAAADFQAALVILPIGLFIAVFLSFFLRETNCKLKEFYY